jgi:hypothetical protein
MAAALTGCALDSAAPRETAVAGANDQTAVPARFPTPTLVPTLATQSPEIELLPPDASAPTPEPEAPPEPTAAPEIPPAPPVVEPTPAPPIVQPTPVPPPPVVPTTPPVVNPPQPAQNGTVVVRLEDTDWSGGFRNPGGYRGRSATWIYGTSTQYSTMQAAFALGAQPAGEAILLIEGMDSEGGAKTPISITVNGREIYNGPNLLPDDEYPFQVGTWATAAWSFDAGLLRPGQNTITIRNLAPGAFSLPPFFMLDYAVVRAPVP